MLLRLSFIVVGVVLGLVGGCGMSITPPTSVSDPVEVYIADHGIHTSLILPREDGRLTQFTYSRFDWAALDQDQWYRSLPALMIPGSGTIGTRDFPGPPTKENLAHQFEETNHDPPMQSLHGVRVSASRCRDVTRSLEDRWMASADTAVYNKKRGMKFVRDSTQYSLFHNCNNELAGWLKQLGCKVDGAAVTADISVRTIEDPGVPSTGSSAQTPTP